MKNLCNLIKTQTGHRNSTAVFVVRAKRKTNPFYISTSAKDRPLLLDGKDKFSTADKAISAFVIAKEKLGATVSLASRTVIKALK